MTRRAFLPQLDWVEQDSGLPLVSIGHRIRTNYGTGPYKIAAVSRPCTCPEFVRSLDGDRTPSEEHYHITVRDEDGGTCWLNGYRLDGTNVWRDDKLFHVERGGEGWHQRSANAAGDH